VRALLKDFVVHIGVGTMTEALYSWISQLLIACDGDRDIDGDSETAMTAIFTPTELSVLRELKTGGSNKEIARRLSTTENTIKFHMKNIFRKLGVNTRRLAIEVASQRNLLGGMEELADAAGTD
jgi:LuxR family maltose regulon positive regulatory protein